MRGRQTPSLINLNIHLLSSKRPLYPGQLPAFRFENETETKANTTRATRPNVAEHRAATRISMSTLRRRKLQQFDYETFRADFAKGYVSTMPSADALAFSTYNTLMMTWKNSSETGLRTFPTRRSCMVTSTIKSMTCCTISSERPADASDMIDRTILSSLSLTSDFHV